MSFWIGILIFIGVLVLIPVLIFYGLRVLMITFAVAGVAALIGAILDWGFGTSPTITIVTVVMALIGLVGSSLENLGVSLEE